MGDGVVAVYLTVTSFLIKMITHFIYKEIKLGFSPCHGKHYGLMD